MVSEEHTLARIALPLARIALREERFISSPACQSSDGAELGLDPKTCELARLGALIGLEGAMPSCIAVVQAAQAAGALDTEIVGTLVAVLPSVGAVRASPMAPRVALALGYEPDMALDGHACDPQLPEL